MAGHIVQRTKNAIHVLCAEHQPVCPFQAVIESPTDSSVHCDTLFDTFSKDNSSICHLGILKEY